MRLGRSSVVPLASALALFAAQFGPATAKPLDADACARLKLQREALEKSGVRAALNESPSGQVQSALDERAQQMRTLIDVDGQLRFRCSMELPIPSLRPDLLVELPDSIEGEAAAKQAAANAARQKALSQRRAKAAAARAQAAAEAKADAVAKSDTPPPGAGMPATPKRKTAVAKPAAGADGDAPASPPAKPKSKTDDAFHTPAAKGE